MSFLRSLTQQHVRALMVSKNLVPVFIEKNIPNHFLIHKKILTVYNLYIYIAVNEIGKLLTLRSPAILFEQVKLSSCNKENLIVIESSCQKESCYHNASSFWNMYIKKLDIPSAHNIIIPLLKHKLKTHLLSVQLEGSTEE